MIELSVASLECQRFSVVTSLHGKITSPMSVHCFSTQPKLASQFLSKNKLERSVCHEAQQTVVRKREAFKGTFLVLFTCGGCCVPQTQKCNEMTLMKHDPIN